MRTSIVWLFTSVFVLILCRPVHADVRLPGFFGDHMVLQQQMPIRVWGWADKGESVTVTIGDRSATATPGANGKWMAELPEMKASKQSHALIVEGKNRLELKDVLIGEVWLCSGQSNMEWSVRASRNAAEEIAAADHPLIRHIKVARRPSTEPLDDITSEWQVCSPETAGAFTACGYFMARELQQQLDVPIGLVNSSWGGTRVEPWTPPIGFQRVEALRDIHQSVLGRTPGSAAYRKRLEQHVQATEKWLAEARDALEKESSVGTSPSFPPQLTPFKSHQDPTMLYNGMIHALVGFPIRGAIWYQGESNHVEGMLYTEKKKALINGWRELWGQGEFPFYYVQIAPFQYGNEDPTILAEFWEAQAAVQELPRTGMVVINDIATLNDIHPPNKQDVGKRLALLALKNDYGRDVVAASPSLIDFETVGTKLKLNFKNTGGGLRTRDGQPPSHFEIAGTGTLGFKPATATIDGDSVILESDIVDAPNAFRFAWNKLAEPNLTGGTGLPVGACRGGDVSTAVNLKAIEKDYRLVYDLDLAKLAETIQYDVDNSDEIQSFDRVGYLVELTTASGDEQQLFLTAKAFTDDVTKVGVPAFETKVMFRGAVEDMEVYTNVKGLVRGSGLKGNIEFWPNNYGMLNRGGIRGASGAAYDFGDDPGQPQNGYGSMQIHHPESATTLFAINHWGAKGNADIGIGNNPSGHSDWTFTGNAKNYKAKRLRVYVSR
ncbi:MAG: sialate O-acetylesterase [Planctomycetota bacterium]